MILQGLSQGLERTSENSQQHEQQSLWKMSKSLRDPDIKASLSTAMDFLQGMGEVLNNNKTGKPFTKKGGEYFADRKDKA